jgi:LmbE family N-acetylglucosaminyl deacetylase
MTSARLRGPLRSIAQATAIAVVLCFGLPALLSQFVPFLAASTVAATSERDFTEDDVNAAVKKVIDERSQDGVFVFRDPKLNADPHLVYEQVKIVRGMEGYGWFANTIFHDNTPSTSGSSQTAKT